MNRIVRDLGRIGPVCAAAVLLCIDSAAGVELALKPVSPNTINHVTLMMNPDVSTPDNRDAYLYLFPYDQETGKSGEFALENDVSVKIAVLDQYEEFNIGLISGSVFAEWTISLLDEDGNVINEDGKKYEWSPTKIDPKSNGSSLWDTPRRVELVDFSKFGLKKLPNFDGTHVAWVRVTQTKEWNGPAKFRLVFLGQRKVEVEPRPRFTGRWTGEVGDMKIWVNWDKRLWGDLSADEEKSKKFGRTVSFSPESDGRWTVKLERGVETWIRSTCTLAIGVLSGTGKYKRSQYPDARFTLRKP
jgi:hypothetical protein